MMVNDSIVGFIVLFLYGLRSSSSAFSSSGTSESVSSEGLLLTFKKKLIEKQMDFRFIIFDYAYLLNLIPRQEKRRSMGYVI